MEGKPFIEIRNGVHPTVVSTFSGDDYIPNDIVVGIKDNEEEESTVVSSASTVLVTGMNELSTLSFVCKRCSCFFPFMTFCASTRFMTNDLSTSPRSKHGR